MKIIQKNEEDNAFNAIFLKNLMYFADKLQDTAFTNIVKNVLQERVDRLTGDYQTLLGHSGAVYLAALNCIDEKDWGKLA